MSYKLSVDFNLIRKAFANQIQAVTGLTQNQVILAEGEAPNEPRPCKPYFSFKILNPGMRYGDDCKQYVGNGVWNSGGPRKMTVAFDCYGESHEEAYNYMCLWQTALDLEDIQAILRSYGIAVAIIGSVADLSVLLNTGYEGRAHMECDFNLAFNVESFIGEIETVPVAGQVDTGNGIQGIGVTVTKPKS